MNSIVDTIFIDNLHIMFGENYLLNTVNTIFTEMTPEYNLIMKQRLYQEMNKNDENNENNENNEENDNLKEQKVILLDYLSGLLKDYFNKVQNNLIKGGGKIQGNKLEYIKNYIRNKVSNIKPKFYN